MCFFRVPRLGWKRCWKRGSSRPWRLETRSTAARPCLACLAQVRKTHEVLRDEHFQRKLRSINSWKARSDPKPMKVSVLKTWHIVAWLPTKLCINCAASHYSATASFHFLIFSPHFSMSKCLQAAVARRRSLRECRLKVLNSDQPIAQTLPWKTTKKCNKNTAKRETEDDFGASKLFAFLSWHGK